jgi:hypothetical protein
MPASVLKLILSLSPSKERTSYGYTKRESNQNQPRERERERTFFLFHHLFSYSAVSLSCLPLAKRYISLSLSLSLSLALSCSLSLATREREIRTDKERAREKKHSSLTRYEVPPTIVSLTSQLMGTQSPGSLRCLRPCDNASRRIHQVASDLGSPLTKGNNERRHLQAVEHAVFNPEGAEGGSNASHMLP